MKTLIYAMDSVIISFMYDFINAIFPATTILLQLDLRAAQKFTT